MSCPHCLICVVERFPGVQGQSLAPVLSGQKERLAQDFTFIETPFCAMSIRTPTHMYGMLMNSEDTGH